MRPCDNCGRLLSATGNWVSWNGRYQYFCKRRWCRLTRWIKLRVRNLSTKRGAI